MGSWSASLLRWFVRLTREDRTVLVQLAKVTAACALPIANFTESEQSSDAILSIFLAVLAPFQLVVNVTAVQRKVDWQET